MNDFLFYRNEINCFCLVKSGYSLDIINCILCCYGVQVENRGGSILVSILFLVLPIWRNPHNSSARSIVEIKLLANDSYILYITYLLSIHTTYDSDYRLTHKRYFALASLGPSIGVLYTVIIEHRPNL